jgi:hypothetical protein
MVRTRFRTSVMLVTIVCFLALVLPFWVPSVGSKVLLPDGPPGEGADPDDIAVNSSKDGTGGGKDGEFELGDGRSVVMTTEGESSVEEVSAVSVRRDSDRWLWLVWKSARQLVFRF